MIRKFFLGLFLGCLIGGGAYLFVSGSALKAQDEKAVSGIAPSAGDARAKIEEESASANPANAVFWAKRCEKDTGYCEIFQRLDITKTKQRLIEFAIGFPKDSEKARAVAILPLGLMLQSGVSFKVGDGEVLQQPIRTCVESGCLAIFDLSDEMMESMKSGDKMTVFLKDNNGKPVNIDMALKGLSEAMDQL